MATTGKVRGINVSRQALARFGRVARNRIAYAVRSSLKNIDEGAKHRIAVDKGNARKSIIMDVDRDGLGGIVGAWAKHARYIEDGTGIYGPRHEVIRPRRKKFLRWKGKDKKWHFARRVRGMRPRPWLRPAFNKERPRFLDNLPKAVRKAVREVSI